MLLWSNLDQYFILQVYYQILYLMPASSLQGCVEHHNMWDRWNVKEKSKPVGCFSLWLYPLVFEEIMNLACACSNFLLEVIPISYAYISYSSFIPLSLYWCACPGVSFRVASLVPASIVIVFECEQINCPMVCTSKFVQRLVRRYFVPI